MKKRSGKFYRRNEQEVMSRFGLQPTPNSGSGWIVKEDGQNEQVICQLKSTDAQSIKVNQKDLRVLEYNSAVAHKLPLFVIQFLNTDEYWLLLKPEDLTSLSKYIETGVVQKTNEALIETQNSTSQQPKTVVRSSKSARERFHDEQQSRFVKVKKAT